jgi:hypothetical protein
VEDLEIMVVTEVSEEIMNRTGKGLRKEKITVEDLEIMVVTEASEEIMKRTGKELHKEKIIVEGLEETVEVPDLKIHRDHRTTAAVKTEGVVSEADW